MLKIFLFLAFLVHSHALNVEDVFVSELFQWKIDPNTFNWTFETLTEQFSYRCSKKGHADLPRWLNYMYSKEHHCGFLFGTPPAELAGQTVPIEIIALDELTYDTRKLTVNLMITERNPPRSYSSVIAMKIDNLNWIHIMDPGRVETLKNIFRRELWPESMADLELVFMDSAVKLGARRPINPQEREGVVVHLGSTVPFSQRLLELQEEVKPLYKMQSCSFKRTSVETLFESSGFKLDWCSFRIIEAEKTAKKQQFKHDRHNGNMSHTKIWEPLSKDDLPVRNYSDELAISIAVPGVILTLLIALLTVVLCFEHESLGEKPAPTVQMVHYSTLNNQPTTTLKSLREITPTHFVDDASIRSTSPSGSMFIDNSPLPVMRPLPPPYKSRNGGVHI
ncbi:epsilon-sarcoglycan isoform X2 [Culicoides brevitarsis]|uniref:epsilon-sarcoglycan isoform X2 n=1 Tax=Culicoides brevitarsis TaxID=469753 RepID=UPI00307C23B8